MLPRELCGPGKTIGYAGAAAVTEFVERNAAKYPHLDRDFIIEICFEHSDRFNELFPHFDVALHSAVRVRRTTSWLIENVRYDDGEPVTFHLGRFRMLMRRSDTCDEVLGPMLANGTWHFPPVIIAANLALSLGGRRIASPYYLIEGTHRLSYLHGMLERGLVGGGQEHEVIEVHEVGAVTDRAHADSEVVG